MDTGSEDAIGFVPAGLAERPVWHVAHESVEAVGVFKQMADGDGVLPTLVPVIGAMGLHGAPCVFGPRYVGFQRALTDAINVKRKAVLGAFGQCVMAKCAQVEQRARIG